MESDSDYIPSEEEEEKEDVVTDYLGSDDSDGDEEVVSFHDWDSHDDSGSDESELDYDDTASEDADGAASTEGARRYRWTVVTTCSSLSEAKKICDDWGGFVYTYTTRYKTDYCHARTYACRSHVDCSHRLKITHTQAALKCHVFTISETGIHAEAHIHRKRRGIHTKLKDEVDCLLKIGMGPKMI